MSHAAPIQAPEPPGEPKPDIPAATGSKAASVVHSFGETCWANVLKAAFGQGSEADEAWGRFAQQYWKPLYVFCRFKGDSPQLAEDHVQGLFEGFLARNELGALDPSRGRLRSWLMAAMEQHRTRVWRKASAQKRNPVNGFDPREEVGAHTFCSSVVHQATRPVALIPLHLPLFSSFYAPSQRDGTNAFIYTRFLTPYLMGYKGWAIFADGDMVCNADIAELWKLRDPSKAVLVAKHDYQTKAQTKYLGNKNENYPRKNWSSVILWNCEHPENRQLTPAFVESKDGAFLHRFKWLDDALVGEIPKDWNWLAVEYEPKPDAKLVHYTLGTPCFSDYANCEMADKWHAALRQAMSGMHA